jgi:hypothetical protein
VPARAFNQWRRGLATQTQPPPTASSFAQKKTDSLPQQKSSSASAADSNIYEVNEANFLKEAIEASDKRVVLIDCYAEYFPIFSIISLHDS